MTYALGLNHGWREGQRSLSASSLDRVDVPKQLSRAVLTIHLLQSLWFGYSWDRQEAVNSLKYSNHLWSVPLLFRIVNGSNHTMRDTAINVLATLRYPTAQMKTIVANELLGVREAMRADIYAQNVSSG